MSNSWHNQDPLNLSAEEWLALLTDPEIVDEFGRRMMAFVYSQPNYQSSATEIAEALGGVSYQKITAVNRGIAKRIYKKLGIVPPNNTEGGLRWWNALFDGNPECYFNDKGYFIWRLRPVVVEALARSGV
jgi:hypothetical protein